MYVVIMNMGFAAEGARVPSLPLLLIGGVIYVKFLSHCSDQFNGWVKCVF